MQPLITILTPTIGKNSLTRLMNSLDKQSVPFQHILLWDDLRHDNYLYPNPVTLKPSNPYDLNSSNRYSVVIPGSFVQGQACGSALRSIGLMLANTNFVTFLDDDCWIEPCHLESLLNIVKDKNWGYCRRKIWGNEEHCFGVDNFESVGDSVDKKVPYEMVDNNCMIFSRRFGTSGAVLYRETLEYNDDRLFYKFLKDHAGNPGITKNATVNQICPNKLRPMFIKNCTRI